MRTTATKELIKFDNEELPINLEPAKIDFPKYKELKKRVDQLTDSLKDYVVTADSYEQDKKTRAELNRIQKTLSKKRIDIFNEAIEPANEFKQEISQLEKQNEDVLEKKDEQLKLLIEANAQKTKMKELLSKQESTINELSKKIQDKENKDNAEEENRLAFIKRIETLQKDNSDIDI